MSESQLFAQLMDLSFPAVALIFVGPLVVVGAFVTLGTFRQGVIPRSQLAMLTLYWAAVFAWSTWVYLAWRFGDPWKFLNS
jgi:hypothetical protein